MFADDLIGLLRNIIYSCLAAGVYSNFKNKLNNFITSAIKNAENESSEKPMDYKILRHYLEFKGVVKQHVAFLNKIKGPYKILLYTKIQTQNKFLYHYYLLMDKDEAYEIYFEFFFNLFFFIIMFLTGFNFIFLVIFNV